MADIKGIAVSDIHFPKHDPRLVGLFLNVMKYFKPNQIDLVGDIDEAETTSRWVEGTSKEGFSLEYEGIQETRQFLKDIHALAPRAEKHFHDGNHGWYRHVKWLDKNQPQTLSDYVYTPDVLYEYTKSGFEFHYYDKPPVYRYGGLYFHHGDSISKHAGESVRNDCLNFGVSLVRGHSHRLASWHQTYPIEGRELRGYEIGNLCDPKQMDYDRSPNWKAGFAIMRGDDNYAHVSLVEIHDYTCYVDGKKFSN
jgi:hypothetical protein